MSIKVLMNTIKKASRLCSDSTNLRQGVQPHPKVIWDAIADFRINLDSDPDVRRIAAKMLFIQFVGVRVDAYI